MTKNQYKHAVLKRVNGDTHVAWIPVEHAIPGKYVRLRQAGTWTNGWQVVETYPAIVDGIYLQERERDYKSHRSATDI